MEGVSTRPKLASWLGGNWNGFDSCWPIHQTRSRDCPRATADHYLPSSRIAQFNFVRRWDVDAFAALSPASFFDAGVPFALSELYQRFLAQRTTLPEESADAESASARFKPPGSGYSRLLRGEICRGARVRPL